jgi:ferredoxin-thioredoxin reductase catalytic subunit
MNSINITDIKKTYEKLKKISENSGYCLNPDEKFTKDLVKGLLINESRYGYQSCPCRLASGRKPDDLDIICPCDYRDSDLNDYGTCYCALFVSKDVIEGIKSLGPIPERRPVKDARYKMKKRGAVVIQKKLSKTVWRCRVCGYLCGRDEPPDICPICKAEKDRFQRFM